MDDARHIGVKSLSGITPEQACNARARAWAYVFDCFHRREGREGGPAKTAPEDAMKGSKHDRAKTILHP
jgi:hypothetical protein